MNPTTKPKEEPLHKYPVATVKSSIFSHYGIDSSRFNAINWISDDTVLLCAGKFVLFIDLKTGIVSSQDGPADGGVGTVAVHPSREFYVVGERAPKNPCAAVYSWPQKELVHRFEGGASIGYSACCFDAHGTRMSTVASFPDFTLVVWDWTLRQMILRCKCFGSEISTVRFSNYDNSLLVTSGTGHIKFWTMAKTFTGLKLQGTLGKFGRLEVSSITGFVVLPDGKVISGSESGCLLLWEGDLVKCSFVKEIHMNGEEDLGVFQQKAFDYIPCHEGTIYCVSLIHDGKILVTAGEDGFLRYWNREELEVAEGNGLPPMYAPKCLLEVCVSPSLHIRSITICEERSQWSILDSQGVIASSPFPSVEEIFEGRVPSSSTLPPIHFNGGGITCSDISSTDFTIITGGEDGVIRMIDYAQSKEKFHYRWAPFGSKPNAVVFVRYFTTDPSNKTFVAGYSNGTVQLMQCRKSDFEVLMDWKPHTDGLFALALSSDETKMATISHNGTVFFFNVSENKRKLIPVGFCKSPLPSPICAEWDDHEPHGCFLGFESGEIISITAPLLENMNHEEGFEFEASYSLIGIRQRRLPPPKDENDIQVEEEENLLEEKDNGPWSICFMKRLHTGKIVVGMNKEELVYVYDMRIRYPGLLALPPLPPTGVEPVDYVEEPGENLCYNEYVPISAYVSSYKQSLLIVCENAKVILRELLDGDYEALALMGQSHDSTSSVITGAFASFDGSMVVTTGTDGLVVALLRESCKSPSPRSGIQGPPLVTLFAEEEEPPHPVLSIQEQKEANDKAREEAEMQRKMNLFLGKVQGLHSKLSDIIQMNDALPDSRKLSCEDLDIDPLLHVRLEEEKARRMAEARRPFLLETARENIRTAKLRNRFVDNLLYDRFLVRSFSSEFAVASFRTLNPARGIEYLRGEIKGLEDSESDEEEGASAMKQEQAKNAEGNIVDRKEDKKEENVYPLPSHLSASIKHQLDKMDERRKERRERREGYESLLAQKPDPVEDTNELNRLREHDIEVRGECVLRTDPNYRGKREFAPDARAKLHRTIFLAEYIVERRSAFNKKLLAMRAIKEEKIRLLNKLRARIVELNESLDDSSIEASPLSLLPDEEPEKKYTTDREGLIAFAKEREEEKMREEMAKKAQRGFGADLAGAGGGGTSISTRESRGQSLSREQGRQSVFMNVVNRDRLDAELKSKLENIKPSELEEEEKEMRRAELIAERTRLVEECRTISAQFDLDLKELVFERSNVDADLCLVESRLLLLFREYQLLLVFRKRDKELIHNLKATKQGRESYRKQINAQKAGIAEVNTSIDKIKETLRQFNQEAEAYLQEHCPSDKLPYVLKVYHRQIKRKKNLADEDDNDDITSDDDDDYEIDDGIGEEICPNNCEYDVWEEMLRRREIRLDFTDEWNEEKEKLDTFMSCKEDCEKNVENLGIKLKEYELEKELLDAEKRKELNLLNTVVSLRCDQVRALNENGMCPTDLHTNPVLVISDLELFRLNRRITELAAEKQNRREEIGSMAADHQRLQGENKKTQVAYDEWDARVHELMMLKFGQRVDLELLESCGTSRRIEAKKEELRTVELKWEREIRKHEAKIEALRDRLQATLIKNTHLLQDFSAYESERQYIDAELSAATKKTIQRYRGAQVATAKDRMNLRRLIAAQQQEMDALNAEIIMLRRKGGHVYSEVY